MILDYPTPPKSLIHTYAVQHHDFYNFKEVPQRGGYLKQLRVNRSRKGTTLDWISYFFFCTGKKIIVRETEDQDSNVLLNIPLEGAAISLVPLDQFKVANCFKVIAGVTRIYVLTETAQDMFEWTTTLYFGILKSNKGAYYKMHEARIKCKESNIGERKQLLSAISPIFVVDSDVSSYSNGANVDSDSMKYRRRHVDLLPMLLVANSETKPQVGIIETPTRRAISKLLSWTKSSRVIESEVKETSDQPHEDSGIHVISNTLSVLIVEPGMKSSNSSIDDFWKDSSLSLRLHVNSKAPYLLVSSSTHGLFLNVELDMTTAVFATTLAEFSFCVCTLNTVLHFSATTEYIFCEWMDNLVDTVSRHSFPSTSPIHEYAVHKKRFENFSQYIERDGFLSYCDCRALTNGWMRRYIKLKQDSLIMKEDSSEKAETLMVLPLVGCAVDLEHGNGDEFSFKIITGVRTIMLKAESHNGMMDWACSLYFAMIISNGSTYWKKMSANLSSSDESSCISFFERVSVTEIVAEPSVESTPRNSLLNFGSFSSISSVNESPVHQTSLRSLSRVPDTGETFLSGFLFYFSVNEKYASRAETITWRKTQVSLRLDEKSKVPYLIIFANTKEYEKIILDMTSSVLLTTLRPYSFAVCTLGHVVHLASTDRDSNTWIDRIKKAVKEWSKPSESLIHKYAVENDYFQSFSAHLIKQGYLLKQSSEKRTLWIRRYFRLVPGFLLVMDEDTENANTNSFPLAGGTVDLVPFEVFDKPNVFKVISGVDIIIAYADSISEMFEWTTAIYFGMIVENNGDYWILRKSLLVSDNTNSPQNPPKSSAHSLLQFETLPKVFVRRNQSDFIQIDEVKWDRRLNEVFKVVY